MNSYERVYGLILEAHRSNPQLDYILKSKEKVMSGATRAFRKGARKARQTGVGNKGENKTLDVPRTFKGMLRRGRQARKKGKMKKFVSDVALTKANISGQTQSDHRFRPQ